MRKLLFMLGLFSFPCIVVGGLLMIILLRIVVMSTNPPCSAPVRYHLFRMHAIISRGDMGWGTDVERAFDHLKECKHNRRYLAEQLLSDKNGTIAALGMNLIVEEVLSDGDRMLSAYHHDRRWNFYLTTNDEYSRLLLAMWKMRRNIGLTKQDEEVLARWPNWKINDGDRYVL